ncbi:MAG: rhomboid family protein [Desulfobacterales bacterium]|nr:rhomboid family protein [Desulfobacterales bacterium]
MDISSSKCHNHLQREAVAVCLKCGRFYCRECVTEHNDQVICSSCLMVKDEPIFKKFKLRKPFIYSLLFCIGIFSAWIFFFYIGDMLLSLPSDFHDGTIWERVVK